MLVRAVLNNKGTSLIEILLSIVLVAVVFSALVTSSTLVMNQNVENLMRNEAVSIAEDKMSQARSLPFTALISGPTDTVSRDFRGITNFEFVTLMTVTDIDVKNRMVTIAVTWIKKGVTYRHNISTVVRSI